MHWMLSVQQAAVLPEPGTHLVCLAIRERVFALPLVLVVFPGSLVAGPTGKCELALPMHLIIHPFPCVAVVPCGVGACRQLGHRHMQNKG